MVGFYKLLVLTSYTFKYASFFQSMNANVFTVELTPYQHNVSQWDKI